MLQFPGGTSLPVNRKESPVLVLFGGRNWPGEKTISIYSFNELADKFGAVLISPSFCNHEYWQPEKWSGKVLKDAITQITRKHNLKSSALYYYGYSAGGQCVTLFYAWRPENIRAIALHACGVWPEKFPPEIRKTPFLVTCGEQDRERFQISYTSVQKARDAGADIIFRNYSTGHGLNKSALILARAFFFDILKCKNTVRFVAKDFSPMLHKPNDTWGKRIDIEIRNSFFSEKTALLWQDESSITAGSK